MRSRQLARELPIINVAVDFYQLANSMSPQNEQFKES
jgi:hypothetical protein